MGPGRGGDARAAGRLLRRSTAVESARTARTAWPSQSADPRRSARADGAGAGPATGTAGDSIRRIAVARVDKRGGHREHRAAGGVAPVAAVPARAPVAGMTAVAALLEAVG